MPRNEYLEIRCRQQSHKEITVDRSPRFGEQLTELYLNLLEQDPSPEQSWRMWIPLTEQILNPVHANFYDERAPHQMTGREPRAHDGWFDTAAKSALAGRSGIQDNVPGDFIETGVWRGGASIYMRALLAAHGITDRRVFGPNWLACRRLTQRNFQQTPDGTAFL